MQKEGDLIKRPPEIIMNGTNSSKKMEMQNISLGQLKKLLQKYGPDAQMRDVITQEFLRSQRHNN